MSFVLFVQEASRRQNWVGGMEDGMPGRGELASTSFSVAISTLLQRARRVPAGMGAHPPPLRGTRGGGALKGDTPRLRCGLWKKRRR